jgi:hypothetical protein
MVQSSKEQTVRLLARLTAAAIVKHFPESEETIKGHGRKTRHSTQNKPLRKGSIDDDNNEANIPTTIPSIVTYSQEYTTLKKRRSSTAFIRTKLDASRRSQARGTNILWY